MRSVRVVKMINACKQRQNNVWDVKEAYMVGPKVRVEVLHTMSIDRD